MTMSDLDVFEKCLYDGKQVLRGISMLVVVLRPISNYKTQRAWLQHEIINYFAI